MQFLNVWAEPEPALHWYHALVANLHAGCAPRLFTLSHSGPMVKEFRSSFLGRRKDKLETDEIGARRLKDCRRIVSAFANVVGKGRPVSDLRPNDSQRHRLKLGKRLGVHALTRHVTAIRGAFKYAYDVEMVEDPVKFGKGLTNPSAAQKRKVKQKAELGSGKKLFLREVPVSIPDACGPDLHAPVLRGINGGFRRSRS